MSRREVDRRNERDTEEYPNKRTAAAARTATTTSKVPLNEYFLDGEGIDRQVLQSSICRFLGPEATSRPYEHQVCPATSTLLPMTYHP